MSKKFGTNAVLQNINIRFDKGKIYGIVGENGAGKTTLFRCIAGMETFDGTVVSEHVPLKNYLGFLLTDPFFFSKITGAEYIQLLCNARKIKIANLESRNLFDLPLNQYASTYSSGMKKKLAITALLLQVNEYFIFDEPYNGVDIEGNLIIAEIIQRLKQLNKTIVISSHIFSTLREICDEIILIKNGKISDIVTKENFHVLELKMKDVSIGNKIDLMGLK